jgi:hypothetical protein
MIQQISKTSSVKSRDPEANESQWKQSLEQVAASFGLTPEDVDSAIRG